MHAARKTVPKAFPSINQCRNFLKKKKKILIIEYARKHQPIILPDNPRLSRVLSNPTNRDSHWKSAFQAFSLSLTIISHPHFYTSHAKFRARMPKIYPKQDPQTAEKIRQKIALFAPLLVETHTPPSPARAPLKHTLYINTWWKLCVDWHVATKAARSPRSRKRLWR